MRGFYLRNKRRQPCAYVATDMTMTGVKFAVSTCNPMDEFKKELARSLAIGRLTQTNMCGSSDLLAAAIACGGRTVKERILYAIANDHKMPTRTRLAAKEWLKNPPKPINKPKTKTEAA